jgi:hypothetical protein
MVRPQKSREEKTMALNMRVVVTSGVAATEVPEDIAADLAEAYAALKDLPVNRAVDVDFEDAKAARVFVKQGKSWAAGQTGPNGRSLTFARKGDIKGYPKRVTFRIYEVREGEKPEADNTPAPAPAPTPANVPAKRAHK